MLRRIRTWIHDPWEDLTDRERVLLRRFSKLAVLITVLVVVIPLTATIVLVDQEAEVRSASVRAAALDRARDECLETNGRHDATIAVFRQLYKIEENGQPKVGLAEDEAFDALQDYEVIKSVVNAIAPHRECDNINGGSKTP